eukprot:3991939-Prorocentrum_lima.AAC.1
MNPVRQLPSKGKYITSCLTGRSDLKKYAPSPANLIMPAVFVWGQVDWEGQQCEGREDARNRVVEVQEQHGS